MSRLKSPPSRRRRPSAKRELTLTEALDRVEPFLAKSLSVFYAEMARAQESGDQETVEYVKRAIAEAMRGVPEGEIDEPLMTAIRRRDRKARRAAC